MAVSSSLEDLFEAKLDIANDFVFLNDTESIEFISKAKIMFIIRFLNNFICSI